MPPINVEVEKETMEAEGVMQERHIDILEDGTRTGGKTHHLRETGSDPGTAGGG